MSYLDESGLSAYDSKLKEWVSSQESKTITSSIYSWTKTVKAGAVSCYPVGGTELKPIVDFMFKEILPSGTKGPDNPSTINGVSSVKVMKCGKNLLTKTPVASTMSQRGITVTYNADGSIHLSGTASSSSLPYLRFFTVDPGIVPSILTAGTTLTVSLTCSNSNVYCALYDSDSPTLWGDPTIIYPGTPVTHTMSANVKTASFSIVVTRGTAINCDVYCQIEFGQSATAWEAPADEDYTLSLGNTYYGGLIDFATGTMMVTHFIGYIDSTASFGIFQRKTNTVAIVATLTSQTAIPKRGEAVAQNSSCDSFACSSDTSDVEHMRITSYVDRQFRIYIAYTTLGVSNESTDEQIIAAASSWFTNHPATFVLGLTEPSWQSIQLSPVSISALTQTDKYTPRLNTIYSDQESIQVGYIKSPIHNEFELQQAIMAQGENT